MSFTDSAVGLNTSSLQSEFTFFLKYKVQILWFPLPLGGDRAQGQGGSLWLPQPCFLEVFWRGTQERCVYICIHTSNRHFTVIQSDELKEH